MKSQRPLWKMWVIGSVIVVFFLYGVHWYVQQQADESAQHATRIANQGTQKATDIANRKAVHARELVEQALQKAQHDQTEKDHQSDLSRCARQNFTRDQINRNTHTQAETLHLLYLSRHGAAAAEGVDTPAGKNDTKAALTFVAEAKKLHYLAPLKCLKLYPDPFAHPPHD